MRASKTTFHMEGFALGLALRQKSKATRKWVINSITYLVPHFVSLPSNVFQVFQDLLMTFFAILSLLLDFASCVF